MSKKNLFTILPKPVIEMAINELENALDEKKNVISKKRNLLNERNVSTNVSFVEKRDLCSMSEIILWARNNYPNEDGVSLSVIKEKSDIKDYIYLILLIFTKGSIPLLNEDYKSIAIYCNRIDDELYETFGDNDIIVLE